MCLGKHEYLEVDEEFRRLIPKMNAEEFKQLEANILAVGQITEPIIIWDRIVIDGHHRLKVARKHDLPFHVKRMQFDDNDAAREWMYRNQLGRRNLTDTQRSIVLGELYNLEKKKHGGDRKSPEKTSTESSGHGVHLKASEKLAETAEVEERTVRRAGKLADDVKHLAPAVAESVVNEEVKASRADVHKLAQLPAKEQAKVVEKVKSGKAKSVGEAMKPKADKPEQAVVTDSLNSSVDASVSHVFEFAAEWKKLGNALTNCKSLLTKIKDHETACWLDEQETARLIGQAQTNVKFAMPYTECPKCRRKVKKECSCCKGRGWITSSIFKANASDPDKAWLQARK